MGDVGLEVKIKLVSSIVPVDGELETYEMWLEGQFIEKAGTHYLRYEEVQEDKTIKTTVKLANDQSFIMRSGDVSMRLPLNVQQKERGHYESGYGQIPLVVKAYECAYEKLDHNGRFKTHYDLIIGGSSVGQYTLEIHYAEVQ